ncbi:MAG TPA: pilus assembly protein TadG-related protein [Archangium sp.]|uniref:pilus assembly protein TadG-related protein n=1 Tax=Archangium sp. TaxID=1872627 RepID=UPI002E37E0A1|nr:pilus assembly protein TadG-related protein [Archangium sp.]HEX5746200.1 pilus assembly protein TadG-related protein [Archangium sp.]
MRALRFNRGQTLVLFALSLMLLTLMVVLTLSLSMKVRERTELQTVTDAAAYSNAVATARTFNNIAVLNRAQIAFAVSQAGAQSLISWSTAYLGYVEGGIDGFKKIQKPYKFFKSFGCPCSPFSKFCKLACRCGKRGVSDTDRFINRLSQERKRLQQVFKTMDPAAARQVAAMQMLMRLTIYADEEVAFRGLVGKLGDQSLARSVVDHAAGGTRWKEQWVVPSGAGDVSEGEVAGGPFCLTGQGAGCDLPLTVAHSVNAAMGSRGYPFVTSRQGFETAFNAQFLRLIPPPDILFVFNHKGSGWFTQEHGGSLSILPAYAKTAGADDHGNLFAMYLHIAHGGALPCPPVWFDSKGENRMKVEVQGGPSPVHRWFNGGDAQPQVHRLIPCLGGISSCPGVWPPFVDYNIGQVLNQDNNFGQPKNFAMVQRDPGKRGVKDPWNLSFRFRFASRDSSFNNLDPATDVQTALSTGIAYYHRSRPPLIDFEHWSEPPNLLNPYWRATLVAPDTDDKRLEDVRKTLKAGGNAEGAEVVQALQDQGFKGFQ